MDLPAISQQRVKGGGAVATASPPRRPAAFDLKGTMAPLTVLRLRSADLALVERQLRVKIAQLPHLFLHAPVLLDLGALARRPAALTIVDIVTVLKIVQAGARRRHQRPRSRCAARSPQSGLGILQAPVAGARQGSRRAADGAAAARRRPRSPVPAAAARAPAPAPQRRRRSAARWSSRQAVRGGQVVYAQNNDLVVLAPVNAGAQVIADGHVHIYSTLRGRAVAGAQRAAGRAHLLSRSWRPSWSRSAGAYVMADEIPAAASRPRRADRTSRTASAGSRL